jgi:anti-sigma factor RsiW
MRSDDELLAAYVDGVSELTADERRRVEAWLATSAEARTAEHATRSLLGALRELPREGTEPDWAAMERSIRAAVGPRVPRSWWRAAWRWLAPVTALAMAGAMLALWVHDPRRVPAPADAPQPLATALDAGAERPPIAAVDSVPLWLDGSAIEVDLEAAELLGTEDEPAREDGEVEGLLPTANLAAIDEMSDDELANLEQWLASQSRKKG